MDKVMVAALMEIDSHSLEEFILKKMDRLLGEEHGLFDGKNDGSLVLKILSGSTFMHKKEQIFKSLPFYLGLFQEGNDGAAVGDDIDGVVRLTFFL